MFRFERASRAVAGRGDDAVYSPAMIDRQRGWTYYVSARDRALFLRRGSFAACGAVLLAGLFACGCRGEEVARVKLSGPGDSGEAEWKGGSVKVWADYKGEWKGTKDNPGLTFNVEVKEGKDVVATTECKTSTCGSIVCAKTVTLNSNVKGDCECLMSCKLKVPEGEDYTVSVKVSGESGNFSNTSLVLRK